MLPLFCVRVAKRRFSMRLSCGSPLIWSISS